MIEQTQLLLTEGAAVVGTVVTLPSPRTKAFAGLPVDAQGHYKLARKLQRTLRERGDSLSQPADVRAALLVAVEQAELALA